MGHQLRDMSDHMTETGHCLRRVVLGVRETASLYEEVQELVGNVGGLDEEGSMGKMGGVEDVLRNSATIFEMVDALAM